MTKKKKFKGFTLIEVLIAVTILGILTTIGLVTYSYSQQVVRDARRKDDLRQIATAVELYYRAYGRYPCSAGNNIGDPLSPSTSGEQPSYMVLGSYGAQPYWLKDSGCEVLNVVGGIYDVDGNLIGMAPGGTVSVADPASIKPFSKDMISSMPIDPYINNSPTNPSPLAGKFYNDIYDEDSYGYTYWSPHPDYNPGWTFLPLGQNYVLWAKLENVNDPDSCQNKNYKTCNGIEMCAPPPGGMGFSKKMFVITGC